ncbi:MAG: hypothetical protein LBE31_05265, partial [Deltaproteobacteria bacterium]|nr:hypothetical protein [Deltaproteobacteria bacterium]
MEFSRHDLVRLTFDGLRSVSNDLEKAGLPPKLLNEMFFPDEPFKPVCGIVRREENPREGLAPVGYTSWPGPEGHRWRLAGFVRLDHIEGLITPEEAILWNLQNDLELSAAR